MSSKNKTKEADKHKSKDAQMKTQGDQEMTSETGSKKFKSMEQIRQEAKEKAE